MGGGSDSLLVMFTETSGLTWVRVGVEEKRNGEFHW